MYNFYSYRSGCTLFNWTASFGVSPIFFVQCICSCIMMIDYRNIATIKKKLELIYYLEVNHNMFIFC